MKNKLLLLAGLSAMSNPMLCNAQAAPAAAEPPPAVTGNATLASDYRFCGISQTFGGPAMQGGFDYSHASGVYFGNWNSNVSGLSYPNGASLEMDLYGGYKKSFGDVALDVGTLSTTLVHGSLARPVIANSIIGNFMPVQAGNGYRSKPHTP